MKRLALILGFLFFIGAQNVSANSLTFRETGSHACRVMCGEFRNGEVITGNVYRNGRFVGTYREYISKDEKKRKFQLNIIERN